MAIYTDFKSSMQFIKWNKKNYIYILEELINQGKQIIKYIVPAKIEIKGNEEADKIFQKWS